MKKVFGLIALAALASLGMAQEAELAVEALETASTVGGGLIAIGAGAGTIAERPQAFGQILIYLVIPETIIIFGFVIAFFLNNQIG